MLWCTVQVLPSRLRYQFSQMPRMSVADGSQLSHFSGLALGLKPLLGPRSHIPYRGCLHPMIVRGYKSLGSLPQYGTTPELPTPLTVASITTVSRFDFALCPGRGPASTLLQILIQTALPTNFLPANLCLQVFPGSLDLRRWMWQRCLNGPHNAFSPSSFVTRLIMYFCNKSRYHYS